MILSIGEILADMIGEEQNGVTAFKMYGGGATVFVTDVEYYEKM